ncbi:MAG TPA: SEC-C metal-binding domain-containing protein [Polyangiaceae bacterium]|nr:SEC-C metal-binding domain-containing protein [Polyangiaceae bacterium]
MDRQATGRDEGYRGEVGASDLWPGDGGSSGSAERPAGLGGASAGGWLLAAAAGGARRSKRGAAIEVPRTAAWARAESSVRAHARAAADEGLLREAAVGALRASVRGGSGHASHFLSRLDRVNRDEVDFALGLYRDPGLVRFLLARVSLPEGHERAAISLDDAREGPFLVVTRAGHFVTCLGRGMSTGALPVVTRAQLAAALTVASDCRARARALDARVAEAGGARKLLGALFERSDCLSREEFVAISAWQPLLAVAAFSRFARTAADLVDEQWELEYYRRHPREVGRSLVPELRTFWMQLWSMGHLLTLAAMGDRRWLVDFDAAYRSSGREGVSISWPLSRYGIAPLVQRGAWAVARLGKPLVGYYKGVFATTESPLQLFDAAMALGAIGLRHKHARAEIYKVVAAAGARFDLAAPPAASVRELCAKRGHAYAYLLRALFDAPPEELGQYAVDEGRRALFARLTADAGARRPAPFASPQDIPEDVARAAFLNDGGDCINEQAGAVRCLLRLAAVARARAEDFYFPAAVVPFVRRRWRPELTHGVFDRLARFYGAPQPRRVEPAPGRNERCPCASGRKFKRCCGAR